ncbi:MAG: hypothetical protein WBV93_08790 [Anaerobacillus sp.]
MKLKFGDSFELEIGWRALIAIIVAGYFLFNLLNWIYNQFFELDPRISASLITGVFVILGTTLSITIPYFNQKKKDIEEEHRQQKIPMYKDFLDFLFRVFMGVKMGKQLGQKEIVQMMSKFTQDLILWGSEDVIEKYQEYRKHFMNRKEGQKTTKDEMMLLEDLLLKIREDMGHDNSSIKKGDILALFINDIDKYFPKEDEPAS